MKLQEIIGQDALKSVLKKSVEENRIAHAQLLTGREGYGVFPLALALAREILQKENPAAAHKVGSFNHLDVHFSFPVFTEDKVSLSQKNFEDFREMMLENPYADFEEWTRRLHSENKQLFISAEEADEIVKKFSLKSFEGGTKILIMWRADKMNIPAANKFLKFLEEPPEKTVVILTAENTADILPTILSRCQITEVPPIDEDALAEAVSAKFNQEKTEAVEAAKAAQGDINAAFTIASGGDISAEFEELFIKWVRDAFMVKKNPALLRDIIRWSREIASWSREKQKNFLLYSAEIFRLALIQNYGPEDLVYRSPDSAKINWEKFSKYIHGANIEDILSEISHADYHLERNANPKIVWTDFGIKMTRYLHRSA